GNTRKLKREKVLLSYTWLVLNQLFAVFVVLLLFCSAHTPFEGSVYALLSLIYVSINGFYSLHFFVSAEQALVQAKRFVHLSKLLKGSCGDLPEEIKEEEIALEKARKRFYIRCTFGFLIYVLCFYKLFTSIFWNL